MGVTSLVGQEAGFALKHAIIVHTARTRRTSPNVEAPEDGLDAKGRLAWRLGSRLQSSSRSLSNPRSG